MKNLSILVAVFISLLFLACPKSPDKNPEKDPWSWYGLQGYDVKKLRLFDNQLYAITDQHGLFRRNILVESSDWEYLGFEDSLNPVPNHDRVWDVYVNTLTPRKLLISTQGLDSTNCTIFVSGNDGLQWTRIESTPKYEKDGSLYFAISGELVGFGDTVYSVFSNSLGVFKSEDFGATWNRVYSQSETSIGNLQIHPVYHKIIWGIFSGGPWGGSYFSKSVDGGKTWNRLRSIESEYVDDFSLHPVDPKIAYFSADGYLYKTVDGGDNLEQIMLNDSGFGDFLTITIDSEYPEHIFVLGRYQTTFQRLLESWNNGIDWSIIEFPYEVEIRGWGTLNYDEVSHYLFFPTQAGVLRYKSD